jgi:CheY-like chemotaxis protein
MLHKVSDRLSRKGGDVYKLTLVYRAAIERSAKRYHDALPLLTEVAPLFDESTSHTLRAKFHNGLAITLEVLGTSEKREDFIDRALVEYAAASYHFEQAGDLRYCACVENNLAMLYLAIGKPSEAHQHLDRARPMLASLKDNVHIAQVDETRAKVLLAEGRNEEAEKAAAAAARALSQGDEYSLLAEALTTYGTALARSGRRVRASLALQRAVAVAEQAGDKASAGRALLAMLEELGDTSAPTEVCAQFEQAAEQLGDSQHGIAARLIQAARMVIKRFVPDPAAGNTGLYSPPQTWEGFSLRKELRRYEKFLIACALRDAGGVVTRAAHMLGYKHHYSLIHLINRRHKSLMPARSPVFRRRPRKTSIIRKKGELPPKAKEQARPAAILHVEDNQSVAEAVKDTLESEGYSVLSCSDGAALRVIDSGEVFDLLIFDNNLPNVNGIELVRHTRQLPHRKGTPLIMLSASDVEAEALEAGADVFLRKPQDISNLAATVKHLLSESNSTD